MTQLKKTQLTELLRNVPKDLRAGWPTQWSDDGSETGHAMCPIGRYCQDAADRIEELEAENAELERKLRKKQMVINRLAVED